MTSHYFWNMNWWKIHRKVCVAVFWYVSWFSQTNLSSFEYLWNFYTICRTIKNKRADLHPHLSGFAPCIIKYSSDLPAISPAYVRLLGFKKESSSFLRILQKNSDIPIITKAADYKKLLPKEAHSLFEKDLFASNLYETVKCNKKSTAFTNDLQKPPIIL